MFETYIQKYTNDAPCLLSQIKDFSQRRPFERMKVLDATPIYFNTLLKYEALLAGGASLEVFCNERFYDYRVIGILQQYGIPVRTRGERLPGYDVIFDCGAELVLSPAYKGKVEMTASGIDHYKGYTEEIVDIDHSRLKKYMSHFGTADGLIRALEKLGLIKTSSGTNHNAVVFGYGKVGKGIADALAKQHYKVYVIEYPSKPVKDYPCFFTTQKNMIYKLVEDSEIVVSATGTYNGAGRVLRDYFDSHEAFPDQVHFVNMSYARDFLSHEDNPKKLIPNTENDGYPINFILEESTKTCYIDPILALSNICGANLVIWGKHYFKKSSPSGKFLYPESHDEDAIEKLMKKEIKIDGAIFN